jgi:hypothetical protein
MSEVTESLIKELLEEPITVAIYGGGFKPPTKGHFAVVQKTLEDFPEIDELKIFVGGGVRDGITQEESIKIWNIYKNYLSDKIDVEPSVAPVKSVLGYAKDHPDEKVYWILGAREGDEDDFKDIENRTKSIDKYPNIEVKVITTAGGVSGTKTRAAIASDNKEQFFNLIPDVKEKEEIWNILSPIVKEGLIDSIKSKFSNFIQAVKQEGKETKQALSLLIKSAKGETELSDDDKKYIGEQLKDVLKLIGLTAIAALPGGFIAGALLKLFKAEFLVTPSAFVDETKDPEVKARLKHDSDYIESRKESSKEKTQRLNKMKEASDPQAGTAIPYGSGFAPVKEKLDPFGLNAYAHELVKETFEETWNPKDSFVSLSVFMRDNGMNVTPLPKIKVISDDKENASRLLGKTAYYSPSDKSITLYTFGRHPKDILRSFAHEMVHHMQNLEGRLNNITTQNTNEDGDLPKIEEEAYKLGNMMLRKWEDSKKNV